MKIKDKINNLWETSQYWIKIGGFVILIGTNVLIGIREAKPYLSFLKNGPELVERLDRLNQAYVVLAGVVSSDLENLDNNIYIAEYKDREVEGILKKTRSGNSYIFLADTKLGKMPYLAIYDYDMKEYIFFDFDYGKMSLKVK